MIKKKKFVKIVLNNNIKVFVIYITSFNYSLQIIYLVKKTLIILLFAKKIKIFTKYFDFLNVFSETKTLILLKLIKLNQHFIKLQKDKQLF